MLVGMLRFYDNVAGIVLVIFYFIENIVLPNFSMTVNYPF
jgi:hypothetical protein